MKESRLKEILGQFKKQEILVIGDLILDRFVFGKVRRISPEAPVPIVQMERENFSPGGAGNVAANITSLGAKVKLIGGIGDDKEGKILREILEKKGIKGVFLQNHSRRTILKSRIIATNQQLLRLDQEDENSLSEEYTKKIEKYVEKKIKNSSAILISDYGKGMITPSLLSTLTNLAKKYKKIIAVDPKIEHFSRYKDTFLLTPNCREAALGMKESEPKTQRGLLSLGKKIRKKLRPQYLVITRGEEGMTIFEKEKITHIPAKATREVFDVTGAGDTVIGVATLALSAGAKISEAAVIASFAAGVVVSKLGTATVSQKELIESFARIKKL